MRWPKLLVALAPLLIAAGEAALPADQESEHVVKAGETLSGVAQRAGVPRILIVEANHLTSPFALRAGQKLTIPRTRHHTVGGWRHALHHCLSLWSAVAGYCGCQRD